MRKRFSLGSSVGSTSSGYSNGGGGGGASITASSSLIPSTFSDNLPLPAVFVFDLDYTLWPFWVDTHCSPPLRPITSEATTSSSPSSSSSSSSSAGEVTKLRDRHGEDFGFYPGVPVILWAARQRGLTLSIASRTHAPPLAETLLRSLTVSGPPSPPSWVTSAKPAASMPPNSFLNGSGSGSSSRQSDEARSKGGSSSSSSSKPVKAITLFTAPQIYPGSKVTHLKKIQGLIPKSALLASSSSSSSSSSLSTTASTSKKRRAVTSFLSGGGSSSSSSISSRKADPVNTANGTGDATGVSGSTPDDGTKSGSAGSNVIPFEDFIFFDDEARNRNVETELGVTFVLVHGGLTRDAVDRGVWEWRRRRLGIVQGQSQSQGHGGSKLGPDDKIQES